MSGVTFHFRLQQSKWIWKFYRIWLPCSEKLFWLPGWRQLHLILLHNQHQLYQHHLQSRWVRKKERKKEFHLVNVATIRPPCAVDAGNHSSTSKRKHVPHVDSPELACAATTGLRRPSAGRWLVLAACPTSKLSADVSVMDSERELLPFHKRRKNKQKPSMNFR